MLMEVKNENIFCAYFRFLFSKKYIGDKENQILVIHYSRICLEGNTNVHLVYGPNLPGII